MSPLEILSELKHQDDLTKHSHLKALPYPRYNDRTAWGLSVAIVDFLNLRGHWTTRCEIFRPARSGPWMAKIGGGIMQDILAVIRGRTYHIALEIDSNSQPFCSNRADGGAELLGISFNQFFNWYVEHIEKNSLKVDESTG